MLCAPPLSLYVHLPWCVSKCPYCDYNSWSGGDAASRSRYLAALIGDLESEAARAGGRPLISIFLGGGTPSLFPAAEIGRLLEAIAGHFRLSDAVEVTMEANPGTLECGEPKGYRAAGVNRLSIGAQSFDARMLAVLGRIHAAEETRGAVHAARDGGFDNINIDIMYALPRQDLPAAMRDIEEAARLAPEHISWYQLTLEPNTVFCARPPAGLPGDELAYAMQRRGEMLLGELGYEAYEVSAYARDDRRCRHNLNYWTFGDYVAVGAGAHGKLSAPGGVYRYAKPANPRQYMQSIESRGHVTTDAPVTDEQLLFEFMLNALRLTEGFDVALFTGRTGLAADVLERRLEPLLDRGLMGRGRDGEWLPTATGRRFLNDLQAHFLPDR